MAQDYHVELVRRDGATRTIDSVLGVQLDLEHTAVSGLQVEVPPLGGLGNFAFGYIDLYYGESLVFRALAEELPIPTRDSERLTLAGRGEGRELARGHTSYSIDSEFGRIAIADAWTTLAPEWTVAIADPAGEDTVISDFQKEGTPMEILRALHEEAGWRFTVQHGNDATKTAESFPRGGVVKTPDWTVLDAGTPALKLGGYAARVVVQGAKRADGTRPSSTVVNQAELDRLESEFGLTDASAVTWSETDTSKTTDAGCNSKAQAILDERVGKDSLSGDLDITPCLCLPGYHYEISEWSDDPSNPLALSVDSVSIDDPLGNDGDPSATVSINAPGGLADVVGNSLREQASIKRSV